MSTLSDKFRKEDHGLLLVLAVWADNFKRRMLKISIAQSSLILVYGRQRAYDKVKPCNVKKNEDDELMKDYADYFNRNQFILRIPSNKTHYY